jgi:hypothetical protein
VTIRTRCAEPSLTLPAHNCAAQTILSKFWLELHPDSADAIDHQIMALVMVSGKPINLVLSPHSATPRQAA